jgi:hypothetical protein
LVSETRSVGANPTTTAFTTTTMAYVVEGRVAKKYFPFKKTR